MTYSQIKKEDLLQELITPVSNPLPNWYNVNKACIYHIEAPRHSIERFIRFKIKVQKLKDTGLIKFGLVRAQSHLEVNPSLEHKK